MSREEGLRPAGSLPSLYRHTSAQGLKTGQDVPADGQEVPMCGTHRL